MHVKLKPKDVFLDFQLESYQVSYQIIHTRLIQYNANIYSFFFSIQLINSHRVQSLKSLDSKNNYVLYFYEAYGLVRNKFLIKQSHKQMQNQNYDKGHEGINLVKEHNLAVIYEQGIIVLAKKVEKNILGGAKARAKTLWLQEPGL